MESTSTPGEGSHCCTYLCTNRSTVFYRICNVYGNCVVTCSCMRHICPSHSFLSSEFPLSQRPFVHVRLNYHSLIQNVDISTLLGRIQLSDVTHALLMKSGESSLEEWQVGNGCTVAFTHDYSCAAITHVPQLHTVYLRFPRCSREQKCSPSHPLLCIPHLCRPLGAWR